MQRSRLPLLLLLLVVTLALPACADDPLAPQITPATIVADESDSDGASGIFHRYVAIGTSVTQGWRSDGVIAEFQQTSWPAQLTRFASRELSLPLVASPGCGSPLVAPIARGVRSSGESAAAPFPASRSCAPNEPGAERSQGNLGIAGARTIHALTATPEAPDPSYAPLYARVLAPGMSQVTSMEAQHPKLVSVELGANELLGAREGALVPGQTIIPLSVWAPQYKQVTARVAAASKRAVLVGLINHASSFPSFRTGAELWAARATFAPFNVSVSTDCSVAPGSENTLFVPVRVPLAAGEGAARARAGTGPAVLSCANAPPTNAAGQVIRDYVLSRDELAAVDAQLAQMNAIIRAEAAHYGFAYFTLSPLYEGVAVKAPFSAVTLLTSPEPYGPYVSLDGFHPTADGARVIAETAAHALNATYNLGLPTSAGGAIAPLIARR